MVIYSRIYMEKLSLIHVDFCGADNLARSHEAEANLLAAEHSKRQRKQVAVLHRLV